MPSRAGPDLGDSRSLSAPAACRGPRVERRPAPCAAFAFGPRAPASLLTRRPASSPGRGPGSVRPGWHPARAGGWPDAGRPGAVDSPRNDPAFGRRPEPPPGPS